LQLRPIGYSSFKLYHNYLHKIRFAAKVTQEATMPPTKSALKKQPLTLAQISTYDDILTDALVDHVR
jgi:hypothetical protein